MAVTIETRFESAVTEAGKDAYTGSCIEGRNTVTESDMRKRDRRNTLKTESEIKWYSKTYTVDVHEFSTFHSPIVYRFIMSRGDYSGADGRRKYFTPEPSGVSTHHHMSRNIIRPACFSAVICGVTLRNTALIYSALFQVPVSESCIKRRTDETGSGLPEEDILKKLRGQKEPTGCHTDAYYPPGTDRCVTVIKDDYDRILITHETDSESGEEAKKFPEKVKELRLNITYAFPDYSKSFTSAVKEVFPDAEFQADHFHTAKNIWKHLKKALPEYRREIKPAGGTEKNSELTDPASDLWKLRWSLLKKPSDPSQEEREKIGHPEERDAGFIKKFRSVIRQIVNISDYSDTEKQARIKPDFLKTQVGNAENSHLNRICVFLNAHWDRSVQYLKKRGPAEYRRSSNSESGMRILRRPEKNHDGIRSEVTRKNYVKIYRTIKYLSEDITGFLEPVPDL